MSKEYSSRSSTGYGYIIEWRLKPESIVLTSVLPWDSVSKKWKQANYSLEEISFYNEVENRIIKPYIDSSDKEIAKFGLVTEEVAEAILACLKTTIEYNIRDHIEWRITCMKYEDNYKVTYEDRIK